MRRILWIVPLLLLNLLVQVLGSPYINDVVENGPYTANQSRKKGWYVVVRSTNVTGIGVPDLIQAKDLAEALNEAHERRINKTPYVIITTTTCPFCVDAKPPRDNMPCSGSPMFPCPNDR